MSRTLKERIKFPITPFDRFLEILCNLSIIVLSLFFIVFFVYVGHYFHLNSALIILSLILFIIFVTYIFKPDIF